MPLPLFPKEFKALWSRLSIDWLGNNLKGTGVAKALNNGDNGPPVE